MFLKYRPVALQDLPVCLNCIRDGFAYDAESRLALLELWRELISSGAANAAVIEDLTAGPADRIIWFCLKVFVDKEYAQYLKAKAPPLIGRDVLTNWTKGRSPLLGRRAVERANSSGGVQMLVLNSGAPSHMQTPDVISSLSNRIVDFTMYHSCGYRCNEFLEEFYDEFEWQWAEGAGFIMRTDYAASYYTHGLGPNDPQARLYGATPQEARQRAGTVASVMLEYREPVIYFKRGEQELLLHALLGETDETLSKVLNLAPVTLHKRWENIYERVEAKRPAIFAAYPERTASSGRGSEKKRRLLLYLRQHLEELRPHDCHRQSFGFKPSEVVKEGKV